MQPSTKGGKAASPPSGKELHCDSLCSCWAQSSLLIFNCCRQKPDQSVLGVCFIVGILCSVSHKVRGHSSRDKQMMTIYGVPDGGVWCSTEWNCLPRKANITVSTFSTLLQSVRSLSATYIHKHDITCILEHFSAQGSTKYMSISWTAASVICLTEAWGKIQQYLGTCKWYLLFLKEISAD